MSDEKILATIRRLRPKILEIGKSTSFGQIFKKIKSSPDFVLVKKTISFQMFAVLLLRLTGKKFIWIQNFTNPPTPNFFARLLLNQADKIIIAEKKELFKLKKLGIDKPKIRIKSQV